MSKDIKDERVVSTGRMVEKKKSGMPSIVEWFAICGGSLMFSVNACGKAKSKISQKWPSPNLQAML